MKILTDFRETVETGMDPRLYYSSVIVRSEILLYGFRVSPKKFPGLCRNPGNFFRKPRNCDQGGVLVTYSN